VAAAEDRSGKPAAISDIGLRRPLTLPAPANGTRHQSQLTALPCWTRLRPDIARTSRVQPLGGAQPAHVVQRRSMGSVCFKSSWMRCFLLSTPYLDASSSQSNETYGDTSNLAGNRLLLFHPSDQGTTPRPPTVNGRVPDCSSSNMSSRKQACR
jgi:hypothetical protein